jgi:hypothetical protein
LPWTTCGGGRPRPSRSCSPRPATCGCTARAPLGEAGRTPGVRPDQGLDAQDGDGILRWHITRINNGILEAINSPIQAAKRKARGHRTKANLITMIYLIAGKLDLAVTHTK